MLENDNTNEEQEDEGIDVLSLFTGQSDDGTDDAIDDGSGAQDLDFDNLPNDPETLKQMWKEERERTLKRNKSVKTSKETTHRVLEENELLKQRLDKYEQKLESIEQQPANAGNPEQEAQEWREKFEDDPYAASMAKQQETYNAIADAMTKQNEYFEAKLKSITVNTDPEIQKYKKDIDALRTNPDFANLDESVLATIAKGLDNTKRGIQPRIMGRAKASPTVTKKQSEDNLAEMLRKMGY